MKIGFYGGMNNNLYILAKESARQGEDILFIRDPDETFVHCQPFWEDIRTSIKYTDVSQSNYNRSVEDWESMEDELEWTKPSWVVNPHESPETPARPNGWMRNNDLRFVKRIFKNRFPLYQDVLMKMQECDFLVVCGAMPTILAYLSGAPYMPLPYGTDLRIATGHFKLVSKTFKDYVANLYYRRMLLRAFNSASFIGTTDPTIMGASYGHSLKPYLNSKLEHERIGLPYSISKALSDNEKRDLAAKLFRELELEEPVYQKLIFIPARIDLHFKGHDMLVAAINSLQVESGLHFIFLGWGADYEKVKLELDSSMVTFLPAILSKPLLKEFYQAVDLVIDQLREGTYGSVCTESISVGTPVMIYIEPRFFDERGWSAPPAVNASNKAEVSSILNRLAIGDLDLAKYSHDLQSWMRGIHDSKTMIEQLLKEIRKRQKSE